jgi:hypothetical protein
VSDQEKRAQEGYEAPEVEQIPTDSGPSVTAAGDSPSTDFQTPGVEWRPHAEPDQD